VPTVPRHRQLLGEKVRLYRKLSRLTQEQLAEKAELAPTYLSDVERGRENSSVDVLNRIAKALAVQQLVELNTARGVAQDAVAVLATASETETMDDAELLSGGWHLIDPPTPPGPMPAPENLVATGGDLEGEADLAWEPVTNRDAYLAEWAADPMGPWTQFYVGTKSSCTASGLNPGQMYYFRVRAVGPLGPGPWSDIAQKRAS